MNQQQSYSELSPLARHEAHHEIIAIPAQVYICIQQNTQSRTKTTQKA